MINTIEVKLESMAYGGEALGRLPDGRVIFVPYVIPGEVARIKVVEDKPKFARGELMEIMEPATGREVARCAHYSYCGGCHYQHMGYQCQLNTKATILREQLERIGGLHSLPELEIKGMDEPWYYRNTIQFHLTREGKLGFQRAHSNQSFAIRECHLPEPVINRLWPQIETEPIHGLERISIRSGSEEEVMVVLECSDTQPVDFSVEGLPVSVVQVGPKGSIVLVGSNELVMEVLGRKFQVSAGSFFQVNSKQAQVMVRLILDQLTLREEMTVLDAYCGVGLFSAFLAPKVKRLVGIEVSPEACEDFTANLDEFENVELYEAQVEDVLGSIEIHPDVIVMDPPRAGLGINTVKGILAQGASQLAYVSCDPATMARDARQLVAGGYLLKKITMIDMFPQTYHIESISLWEQIK